MGKLDCGEQGFNMCQELRYLELPRREWTILNRFRKYKSMCTVTLIK